MQKLFNSEEIKTIENHYSEQSIKNIKSLAKKINENIALKHFSEINDKADVFDKVISNMGYSKAHKANLIFQVVKLLKLIGVDVNEKYNLLVKQIGKERQQESLKKREKKQICNVTIDDLYNFVKTHNKPLTTISLFSVLRCCPIRLSEFHKIRFVDNKINNYIDIKNKSIIIREHKNTKKTDNVRLVAIDDLCVEDLKKYLNNSPKSVELFENKTKKQIQNIFSEVIKSYKKVFGIKNSLGIHQLRTQEEMKNMKALKPGMKTEDLNKMISRSKELGHSLETALTYYTVEQEEEPEPEKQDEQKEIIKILDHEGDDDKPNKLYVKFVDHSMGWLDINKIDMWSICELITKYKRSL
jgi:integrase